MNLKKHIPNTLTCLNLFCGMAGIYHVMQGEIFYGAYFIFAAALFDFLDGFVARMLQVHSEIGKQLDSLADIVTFGVLPSFILFQLVSKQLPGSYWPYLAFFIGIQSALRLAKFNVDTRQTDQFIGVPTPANALLISTMPFLALKMDWAQSLLSHPYWLLAFSLFFAVLMTAELPLIALKFKHFGWKDNLYRYLVLVLALVFILALGIGGIPFVIISYIVLSLVAGRGNKDVPKNKKIS